MHGGRTTRRGTTAVVVGPVLVVVAGVASVVVGVAGSLSFFGQGADGQFSRWTERPLLLAGGVAAAMGIIGLVRSFLPPGRTGRLLPVVVASTVGVAVLVVGLVDHAHRRHPAAQERRAVGALTVAGARTDRTTSGSEPSGRATTAGPVGSGPPVAVRSWAPATCPSLVAALTAWADPGSLHTPPGSGGPGVTCVRFATRSGFSVRALLQGATAVVVVAPPGVGL